jgi:DNA-3-methyladenine glycosylase II
MTMNLGIRTKWFGRLSNFPERIRSCDHSNTLTASCTHYDASRGDRLSHITFSLDPIPPFRLDLTAWALRRRPQNEVDFWDGETYRRVLVIRRKAVLVGVTQTGGVDAPRLEVTAIGSHGDAKNAVVFALERLLGLRIDLTAFYELAAKQPRLHELSTRFRGVKPPRFPTVWEGIVNGVACQQLSLTVGVMLLNRLSSACGLAFTGRNSVSYAFPGPEDLARAAPEKVRSLGFSGAKTRTLIELGREISERRLDLESLAHLKNEQAVSRLVELRGVGRWTAEYALLRGMGRIDLFPGDDIGARNNLERWMRLRKPLDYDRVAHVLRKWKPYGGLVYFHLLLDRLAKDGYLQPHTSSRLPCTGVGESETAVTHHTEESR